MIDITSSTIDITSSTHVYRFKVNNAGADTPQVPTIPGLVGHPRTPTGWITPVGGKVQMSPTGEVYSVEMYGPLVDNGQRGTSLYARDDLTRGAHHGTPWSTLIRDIIIAAHAAHDATIGGK